MLSFLATQVPGLELEACYSLSLVAVLSGWLRMFRKSWTQSELLTPPPQRTISQDSYYILSISEPPTNIVSQGFVRLADGNNYLTRTVQVTTTNVGMFIKGLVVKRSVISIGNAIMADTFDSANAS